jgi:hypothetical protein
VCFVRKVTMLVKSSDEIVEQWFDVRLKRIRLLQKGKFDDWLLKSGQEDYGRVESGFKQERHGIVLQLS